MMGAACLPLPDPYNINSIPYGYCFADIVKTPNTNGTVNIDDLLAVITSGGKRTPRKLDLNAGTRRQRRPIDQGCLILLSTGATAPYSAVHDHVADLDSSSASNSSTSLYDKP